MKGAREARVRLWPNLADERLGGRAVAANDEFFAPKENLVRSGPPENRPDAYTDRGKWMDGWETRRRRTPGHDWAVVRLGAPAIVRAVDVDTRHFRGNHPESVSIEAIRLADEPASPEGWHDPGSGWTTLVPRSPVAGDAENLFPVEDGGRWTHVRLSIHPDGGVARLRVHGEAAPDWERLTKEGPVELAGILHGGLVLACSDEFFGAPLHLLLPGRAAGMWDGWETRRRRGPGHDWVVLRLGQRARVERVEIDTHHFKGNHPESARVEGIDASDAPVEELLAEAAAWGEIVPRTKLLPDAAHIFEPPRASPTIATHLRLSIHPDGGVARLRAIGEVRA